MYFICGIHGAGKTTYACTLSQKLGVDFYSACDLIESKLKCLFKKNKKVQGIQDNQNRLIEAIEEINKKNFILDGHLCLINNTGQIERINQRYFDKMEIQQMYIVIDKVSQIVKRLKSRDSIQWDLQLVEEFQKNEIEYAKELSKILKIPLHIVYKSREIDSFAVVSGGNILLPIKPCYVNRILSNEKLYEYRKTLCKKDINKMYIYSTAPVKRIVGEAEVVEKICMEKEELWNRTKAESGITEEFYKEYFANQDLACAYHLSNIKKYKDSIPLENVGIYYPPQSYVYIGDI